LQRAPEKLRLARKKKLFPFNQLYFLKSRLRSAIKTPEGLGLDGLTEQSAKL